MKFEWDQVKAAINLKKHQVSFEIASTVFEDPLHLSIRDPESSLEVRWITVGLAINHQSLVVVHTDRKGPAGEETIRIISARRATKKERKDYEEGI